MPRNLWPFAQSLYADPAVEQACLRLQERGADVCLLLTGLWLEGRGCACTAERLAQLRAIAEPWQGDVVGPLRQLRQEWKAAAAADTGLAQLREQLKELELHSERLLLERLQETTAQWPQGETAAWLEALAGGAAEDATLQSLRRALGGVA